MELPRIKLPDNVTEAKLARKTGIPQPTLNFILRGKRRANPLHAKTLAYWSERLGLPMSLYDWLYPEDSGSVLIDRSEMRQTPTKIQE